MTPPRRLIILLVALMGSLVILLAALMGSRVSQAAPDSTPKASDAAVSSGDTIFWSNYNWTVKVGEERGPGPNTWAASSVNVTDGTLTLSIRKSSAGVWNCGEVYLSKSLGYGNYSWTITSSPSSYDPNVVLGLFTCELKASRGCVCSTGIALLWARRPNERR